MIGFESASTHLRGLVEYGITTFHCLWISTLSVGPFFRNPVFAGPFCHTIYGELHIFTNTLCAFGPFLWNYQ